MADLDKTKPFGTVYGSGFSYKFEQDGLYFDSAGNEVHGDGKPVSIQEKIERKRKEVEAVEAKKKRLLAKEMEALREKEAELEEESHKLYVKEAAKKIHLLSQKMEDMRTKSDYQEALKLIGYPYEEDAHKSELEAILEEIFVEAG